MTLEHVCGSYAKIMELTTQILIFPNKQMSRDENQLLVLVIAS